mmetsp:Transcript_588/g.632  ORF Transcript_588/g.632 Transcript_588/m.632 type:complete len:118 (+) Transcript_588:459-812(+)
MEINFEHPQKTFVQAKKELILIANYRKVYQLMFRVDSESKRVAIFDQSKQSFFYEVDLKMQGLGVPSGMALMKCLQEHYFEKKGLSAAFVQEYHNFLEPLQSCDFYFFIPFDSLNLL